MPHRSVTVTSSIDWLVPEHHPKQGLTGWSSVTSSLNHLGSLWRLTLVLLLEFTVFPDIFLLIRIMSNDIWKCVFGMASWHNCEGIAQVLLNGLN